MSGKVLSIDEILAANDLRETLVEVPEWGGKVRIRAMTLAEQQRIRQEAGFGGGGEVAPEQAARFELLMLAAGLGIAPEQADRLREKSAAAVNRVLQVILEVNGMTEGAQKAAQRTFRAGDS
ncbi:MAG: hypothetical protein IMW98_08385 [Firmicutes bacterium]|nr:hypothetical protein [Bacillota bacterium]MBE3590823.1 hypothetical protein [Bacillota bacterium]